MANKKNIYPIPKFKTLEEEDTYWQSHSPLAEGYEGKVQKKKQNRESFLSVRLTGEQLARLREIAIHYGLGPSTYARQLLIQGMESKPYSLLPDLLITTLCKQIESASGKQKETYLETLREISKRYLEVQESIAAQIAVLHLPSHQKDEIGELYHKEMRR